MEVQMRSTGILGAAAVALAISAGALSAQTPAKDPSDRLREVLPADVAAHVLATIADARAHNLPAQALQQRALKFAAKGVKPADIQRSVDEQAARMALAKGAIERGRGRNADSTEIEAGAEAIRQGVDGSQVSALAKSAPSGRSLAVPLFVIGSLTDRGLPSDQALQRVLERLKARASDTDLQQLPAQAANGQSHRPTTAGSATGAGHRPATAGRPTGVGGGRPAGAGPPTGVPANPGARGRKH
jgi:hypothetical protein